MNEQQVPSDVALEHNLLSSLMGWHKDKLMDAVTSLEARDFWGANHPMLWNSIVELYQRGEDINVLSLVEADAFTSTRTWLVEWMEFSESWVPNVDKAISRLLTLAQSRAAIRALVDATSELYEVPSDAPEILDQTLSALGQIKTDSSGGAGQVEGLTNARAVLGATDKESESEWIVDGLLREADRVVVVAAEGGGKSVLLKQLAMCTAAGVHPFLRTRLRNGPQSVLIADFENRERTVRNQLKLTAKAMDRASIEIPHVPIWSKPNGINVLDRVDRLQFERVIQSVRPKLVVIGPVYRMYHRGRDHEADILATVKVLDQLQSRYGCAFVLEHHAPLAQGNKARDIRPVDSSIWQRWPEVGVGIQPRAAKSSPNEPDQHSITLWRPSRDPVWWPSKVEKGIGDRPWPFSGTFSAAVVDGRGVPAPPKPKASRVTTLPISEEF